MPFVDKTPDYANPEHLSKLDKIIEAILAFYEKNRNSRSTSVYNFRISRLPAFDGLADRESVMALSFLAEQLRILEIGREPIYISYHLAHPQKLEELHSLICRRKYTPLGFI